MTAEHGSLDTQAVEALAALEHFVVDNDDLLALESLIGKFNIFDALDIARVEIRHSNFLAFILDPAESHGQGQLFLKAVLMDLLKKAPADLRPLSPIDLDGTDLQGVDVRREWGHIDLLITCHQPPFVIVIENKVESHEHSDQLSRYRAIIRDQYPEARPLYVYLTPKADEPSEDAWVPYSYADIHRVFTRVRTTYHNAIGEDVLVFLDHYLSLIGARFMNDAKIDELCQRIYKNHRHALELIYQRVGSPASGVLAEAETVLRGDPHWHVFYRVGNVIDFVPKVWLNWLPPVGLDRKDEPRAWFILRFELYAGRLDFYVEVRRMADLAKRRKIVERLIAEGDQFGFRHSGREIKDNYTRVSGREHVMKWKEDDEPEADTIRAAVKKKLGEILPKLEGVPVILKPLFNLGDSAT
jgi:hypothetical protein